MVTMLIAMTFAADDTCTRKERVHQLFTRCVVCKWGYENRKEKKMIIAMLNWTLWWHLKENRHRVKHPGGVACKWRERTHAVTLFYLYIIYFTLLLLLLFESAFEVCARVTMLLLMLVGAWVRGGCVRACAVPLALGPAIDRANASNQSSDVTPVKVDCLVGHLSATGRRRRDK